MVWPDGSRQEIVGRSAILELIHDERKLANITAKSHAPIRQIMTSVKLALDAQSELLYPVKPRVLFSALGERHAEQIAQIAEEHGIPCAYLHHSMTEGRIRSILRVAESLAEGTLRLDVAMPACRSIATALATVGG